MTLKGLRTSNGSGTIHKIQKALKEPKLLAEIRKEIPNIEIASLHSVLWLNVMHNEFTKSYIPVLQLYVPPGPTESHQKKITTSTTIWTTSTK